MIWGPAEGIIFAEVFLSPECGMKQHKARSDRAEEPEQVNHCSSETAEAHWLCGVSPHFQSKVA